MAGETAETKAYARGGAQFPNHDLEACVAWAERLVSKTHVSSQPKDVIYAAVVDAKGWRDRKSAV